MAKSKSGKASTSNGSATSNKSTSRKEEIEAPEGFDINVGGERGIGWVVKEEGNTVIGRLLGRRTYKTKRGKERGFFQIELAAKCRIQVENEEFNEEADEDDDNQPFKIVTVSEGIVNVDEFKKLEDLRDSCKNGGVYDVWFVMGGKIDIGDDQTMWTLQAGPKLKMIKAPSQPGNSDGAGYKSF